MTIYHGTTNILRYGDFSLYSLVTHEITEIGELKTKKLDKNDSYDLFLTVVGVKTEKKPSDEVTTEIESTTNMDQRTADN